MNCDPLTVSVGSLHTAFNIKDNFSKKLTWLMQKYRITPKQGIYKFLSIWWLFVKQKIWGKKEKKNSFSKWREGAALSPPDAEQSTLVLLTESMSSFFLSNFEAKEMFLNWSNFMMRGYNSLWIPCCSTMRPPCCPSRIQNQRNPGLLCHLWIRLWNRAGHHEVVQRSLC